MRDILLAIAAGIVCGWLNLFPYKVRQKMSIVSQSCLMLMLACLGAKIGCDQEILHNLLVLGLQSLALALAVIGFSAVAVHFIGRIFAAEKAVLNAGAQQQGASGPVDYTMTHKILAALFLGMGLGYWFLNLQAKETLDTILMTALAVMVFLAGIDIGVNRHLMAKICTPRSLLFLLALPAGITLGSLAAGWLAAPLLGLARQDALLAAGSLGWYSLGSVVVSAMYNTEAGTLTFLTNMLRETLAIVLMPLFVRWDKLTAVALAGAATMDSDLPIVIGNTNLQIGMAGFVSGLILTLLVPGLLTWLLP